VVISGSTRLAGVIGNPVRHSMSPAIHNAAYEATGLDWAYVALPVREDRVEAALLGAVALGLEGVSVTMPHKAAAAQFCDELTPTAARLGVVNSIRNVDGTLVGNNTDGTGFLRALLADGWSAHGRRVVVVGAGGTARALTAALVDAGVEQVLVAARREEAALDVATMAGAGARGIRLEDMSESQWGDADLVANTTPVGMVGSARPDASPAPVPWLSSECRVIDAVYHPQTTPLLAASRQRGLSTLGGVELLVGVSAEVFTWWTGLEAPMQVMADAARTVLG
jgi:shikimate dehydrogenase